MIKRGQNSQQVPINIVGSSVFGRYPKISIEKTYNMFQSDAFMVPYAGYIIATGSQQFNFGNVGRGIFSSTKYGQMVVVIDANVYFVKPVYDQQDEKIIYTIIDKIGTLQTSSGVVYITENNKPQLCISDGEKIYIYDQSLSPSFQTIATDFIPGYVTFHDGYFIASASQDRGAGGGVVQNNTWRLSLLNEGAVGPGSTTAWPYDAGHVGVLETKPDNTKAVVRFPSKGNMIFVMGSVVTEAWFDTGRPGQLFPYERNNQFNIDYGCLSPATVAYMDQYVVWLAKNEKSGPIIMYSDGGMPQKITTDGIDYVLSEMQFPEDSQGFLYRQDGHLFYHINFYSDNISLFYDFNTQKFYHASDQNLNFFIGGQIAFFENQYYFVTKTSGNLFAFDTIFTTYQDVDENENIITYEIPRIRTCKNIRLPTQDYFIINDVGFTIESGETDYQKQSVGPITLITQDGKILETQPTSTSYITTQDDQYLISQTPTDEYFITQQAFGDESFNLIAQQNAYIYSTPRVDLCISYDGGVGFGTSMPYDLQPIGKRRNRLLWWQLGIANDAVFKFSFWSLGRIVITDGSATIRT